jgi:hypothetical protein
VKGGAQNIFRDFERRAAQTGNAFGVCRVILLARIVPEELTTELDDPELEQRLEKAIQTVMRARRGGSPT